MADDIKEALTRLEESLSYLVIPYVTSSLAVSTIVDVFPYEPAEALIPEGFKPVKNVANDDFREENDEDLSDETDEVEEEQDEIN